MRGPGFFVFASMIICWTLMSCEKNVEEIPYYGVSWDELKGSKWKLYSIDHNQRGRIELEPKDCDTCYTFTVDKETGLLLGVSVSNKVSITLPFTYTEPVTKQVFIFEILGDELDEPYDGNLYCNTLKLVSLIDFDTQYFGLHFNDCGGHGNCNGTMIFRRIDP